MGLENPTTDINNKQRIIFSNIKNQDPLPTLLVAPHKMYGINEYKYYSGFWVTDLCPK